ncbi:MAG: hypothetical protein U9R73_00520 [Pseudomonadota bacterium]|nr:hypothetical protein [Pseudomonadota bacterium]
MPLPSDPIRWEQKIDPGDRLDFLMELGAGTPPILDVDNGEIVTSYTLTMSAEGVALGLTIGTGLYAPQLIDSGRTVLLWLEVDSGNWSNAQYSGSGSEIGVTLQFQTNNSPARRYERTWALKVLQR